MGTYLREWAISLLMMGLLVVVFGGGWLWLREKLGVETVVTDDRIKPTTIVRTIVLGLCASIVMTYGIHRFDMLQIPADMNVLGVMDYTDDSSLTHLIILAASGNGIFGFGSEGGLYWRNVVTATPKTPFSAISGNDGSYANTPRVEDYFIIAGTLGGAVYTHRPESDVESVSQVSGSPISGIVLGEGSAIWGSVIWVSTFGDGTYVSSDYGETWAKNDATASPRFRHVWCLEHWGGFDDDHLYAVSPMGIVNVKTGHVIVGHNRATGCASAGRNAELLLFRWANGNLFEGSSVAIHGKASNFKMLVYTDSKRPVKSLALAASEDGYAIATTDHGVALLWRDGAWRPLYENNKFGYDSQSFFQTSAFAAEIGEIRLPDFGQFPGMTTTDHGLSFTDLGGFNTESHSTDLGGPNTESYEDTDSAPSEGPPGGPSQGPAPSPPPPPGPKPPFGDPIIAALLAQCVMNAQSGNFDCEPSSVDQYAMQVENAYNASHNVSRTIFELLELDEITVADIDSLLVKDALRRLNRAARMVINTAVLMPLEPFEQSNPELGKKAAEADSQYVSGVIQAAAVHPPITPQPPSGGAGSGSSSSLTFSQSSSFNVAAQIDNGIRGFGSMSVSP